MIYIHKILPLMFSPLFIIILLLILYLIYKRKFLLFSSLFLLFIFSNPIFANFLSSHIEKPYNKPLQISSIIDSDYIVVLSGNTQRFLIGVDLFFHGKGKKLIFTAAKLPWQKENINEGQFYKSFFVKLGFKSEDILITPEVQNTYDEVKVISNMLPNQSSIILVTSAFHMKRAMFLFKKNNFNIQPFPVGFGSSAYYLTFMDFLPSAKALNTSSFVIREFQGRFYYYLKSLLN